MERLHLQSDIQVSLSLFLLRRTLPDDLLRSIQGPYLLQGLPRPGLLFILYKSTNFLRKCAMHFPSRIPGIILSRNSALFLSITRGSADLNSIPRTAYHALDGSHTPQCPGRPCTHVHPQVPFPGFSFAGSGSLAWRVKWVSLLVRFRQPAISDWQVLAFTPAASLVGQLQRFFLSPDAQFHGMFAVLHLLTA